MRPPGIKSLSHQSSHKSNFRESWDAKMLGLSKNTRDVGIKIRRSTANTFLQFNTNFPTSPPT